CPTRRSSDLPEPAAHPQFVKIAQELRARRPHLLRAAVDPQTLQRVQEIEQGTIGQAVMASLRSAHGDEIERLAVLDQLTEVYNVKTFFKELKDAVKRALRYHNHMSL